MRVASRVSPAVRCRDALTWFPPKDAESAPAEAIGAESYACEASALEPGSLLSDLQRRLDFADAVADVTRAAHSIKSCEVDLSMAASEDDDIADLCTFLGAANVEVSPLEEKVLAPVSSDHRARSASSQSRNNSSRTHRVRRRRFSGECVV